MILKVTGLMKMQLLQKPITKYLMKLKKVFQEELRIECKKLT